MLQKEQQLELANACLARFTYGISHELHSPISTLNKLLAMFNEEQSDKLDDDGRELLTLILSSASRNMDIVSALLQYSEFAQPIEHREPVDCSRVVNDVLAELAPVIDQGNAHIDVEPLPQIQASAIAIRQLFFNLISNALKFTAKEKRQPKINISSSHDGTGTTFIVEDDGLGIPPAHVDTVFTVFGQLHARSDYEGAGLGLPICLQIVNALGGRIWVSSTAMTGSAFHVYLPDA